MVNDVGYVIFVNIPPMPLAVTVQWTCQSSKLADGILRSCFAQCATSDWITGHFYTQGADWMEDCFFHLLHLIRTISGTMRKIFFLLEDLLDV